MQPPLRHISDALLLVANPKQPPLTTDPCSWVCGYLAFFCSVTGNAMVGYTAGDIGGTSARVASLSIVRRAPALLKATHA